MKRIFMLIVVAVVVVAFAPAVSAEDAKHPIDIELEKRIDADSSTSGMIEASQWAAGEWDKLLNQNYKALMQKLSKEQQAKLRASQSQWIKYRDLEFDFNASFWAGFKGTMYRVMPAGFQCDFIRKRAQELGEYLAGLDDM